MFIAEDAEVLTRVIALELIARTRPSELRDPSRVEFLRAALLEERWAEALGEWIDQTGRVVDAYPDEHVHTGAEFDDERVALEIRVAPLFRDEAR